MNSHEDPIAVEPAIPSPSIDPETLEALSGLVDCDSPLATLSCLLRAIAELHGADDLDRGLERVARRLEETVPFDSFAIWLLAPEGDRLELRCGLGVEAQGWERRELALGEGASGRAALRAEPVRVTDSSAVDFALSCACVGIRSSLALPLVVHERLLGVLELASHQPAAFDVGHEQLLGVLASNLGIAIENSALYRRLRDGERKLAEDLQAAREIHHRLLPRKTPWVPGLQTAVAYAPARHLGGDVYDFLPYGGPGQTAIAVGDVAGKGTGAALYGSLVVGMLRGYLVDDDSEPAEILRYLNDELFGLGVEKRFIALAFAIFDRSDLSLTLASSGLPYPLLVRDGKISEIEVRGLPLGIVGGVSYDQKRVQLEVGDVLVFASDGIEEAIDCAGNPFSSEKLWATLLELSPSSAREIADGLMSATDVHLRGACDPSDDRTAVVIKVVGS